MERTLSSEVGVNPVKLTIIFVIISFTFASVTITTPYSDSPAFASQLPDPETRAWVDDEFIISYDEPGLYDAHSPDIAVAPPGSPNEGSIHAVWAEVNNSIDARYVEIHYSMSKANNRGLEWSNDEVSEGDKLISQDFTNAGKEIANPGNASDPSIAIDPLGRIHVVWVEQYPDWTYEIHYSSSEDNGITWSGYDGTGDTVVTPRTGEDSGRIHQPRIAVTNQPLVIHIVWDELPFDVINDTQEIWYARSVNQGDVWSQPVQISAPAASGGPSASEPDISTSGPNGEFVHVVWTQESLNSSTSEVFYQTSSNAGLDWGQEKIISSERQDGNNSRRARVAAIDNDVHVIWNQSDSGPSEIFYSGSFDGGDTWTGIASDARISFADGNAAMRPTLAAWGGPNPEVHVVWVEYDDDSPLGTEEIHYSMTRTPNETFSWTGLEADNVLSRPDDGGFAEVLDPAIAVGIVGGKVRPQIVWDELNVASAGKAEHNNEIHYLPDTSFDIPVHLGWNLFSCPLIPDNTSILSVLDDSTGDGLTTWDMVRGYTNDGAVTFWTSYFTAKPASLNDLWNIDHKMGLWINITSLGDGNLTVNGDYGTSTSIQLRTGWNLVGYPAQTSKSVTDALGGINDLPVEGYSASASYLVAVRPGSYMMQPGEGYWVHVASDTVWVIDW